MGLKKKNKKEKLRTRNKREGEEGKGPRCDPPPFPSQKGNRNIN